MYVYPRPRDLREDRDLTQAGVARLLGTVREQYHKYESGKQEIPFHHVITLVRFYNVTIDYIAGLVSEPTKLEK